MLIQKDTIELYVGNPDMLVEDIIQGVVSPREALLIVACKEFENPFQIADFQTKWQKRLDDGAFFDDSKKPALNAKFQRTADSTLATMEDAVALIRSNIPDLWALVREHEIVSIVIGDEDDLGA